MKVKQTNMEKSEHGTELGNFKKDKPRASYLKEELLRLQKSRGLRRESQKIVHFSLLILCTIFTMNG